MTTTAMRTANNRLKLEETTTLHLHQTFLNISLLSLHKHDVNIIVLFHILKRKWTQYNDFLVIF